MHIAILGATSQIAKDLVLSFANNSNDELVLFARRPEIVAQWLTKYELLNRYEVADFSAFGQHHYFDALLNFVGVGNPVRAAAMGESIFSVTLQFDTLALDYLKDHPDCRYVFLSSGAAYGGGFSEPVDVHSLATVPLNSLSPQDWYGVAKLYAECRHRALTASPIVDIRVFSYFSRSQDVNARFLISDALRAIRASETLQTSPTNIVRDYVGAEDFYQLVAAILSAPPINDAIDGYSRASVDKFSLLKALQEQFKLEYIIQEGAQVGVNAARIKLNYFSKNFRAERYGYVPRYDSLEMVLNEISAILSKVDEIGCR